MKEVHVVNRQYVLAACPARPEMAELVDGMPYVKLGQEKRKTLIYLFALNIFYIISEKTEVLSGKE